MKQLNLGTYQIQIDETRFDFEQPHKSIVVVTAKDNPIFRAFIYVGELRRGLDRDDLGRGTVSYQPSSAAIHRMQALSDMASIADIQPKLDVFGHPGFYVFVTTQERIAYRIGFWLDGDDALNIFADFPPNNNLRDEINALVRTIQVRRP